MQILGQNIPHLLAAKGLFAHPSLGTIYILLTDRHSRNANK